METCWLPALDSDGIDVFIEAMAATVSPGCAIFTHEFRAPPRATGGGDGVRPASRPCAGRDPGDIRRPVGRTPGASEKRTYSTSDMEPIARGFADYGVRFLSPDQIAEQMPSYAAAVRKKANGG
jgi:hypothetical protein